MTIFRKRSTTPSYRIILGVSDQVTPGLNTTKECPSHILYLKSNFTIWTLVNII